MRIAVVNQHPRDVVGGSELQCDLVARGLAARGHEVQYLAVTGGPVTGDLDGLPYGVRRVDPAADEIVSACVETGADVVYWRFNRALLRDTASGLADRRIPLVFAVAHADDVSRWPVRPWRSDGSLRDRASELRARIRERRTWGAFQQVAAVAAQRLDFLGRVPVEEQRLVRNLMSTDLTTFTWPRPYVAWVGSLQHRKHPELLPAISDVLAPLGVDLLVAGQLRDERYRSLVEPPTRRPNLHHLGVLPLGEIVGLLAGARLLAMTAHEEGFANVLIQAWWHGTSTVSLGYDPDGLIERHELGLACGWDVDRFLSAVAEAAVIPPEAGSAHRSRVAEFARTTFDNEATLDALESLLEDAANPQR
jgi:glycosyltransferase involved in cell wall biosynthesis